MARLLLPSEYGLVAMLAIFLQISQVFIDSGFTNALIQRKTGQRLIILLFLFQYFYFGCILFDSIYCCTLDCWFLSYAGVGRYN